MNKLYIAGAGVFYVIAFFILFPYYQYLIDPDGISYIKVAERLAANNFSDALNGYWSPFFSWLLAPCIKMGFNAVQAAKYLNGLLGLLCIFSCSLLMEKFAIHTFLKKLLPFCFAFLFLSFCFYELCADLLSLFILSLYFNVVLNKAFIFNHQKLLLTGLLGALAYFAKAYNFYFFIAHISITIFLYCKKETGDYFSYLFIKSVGIALFCFLCITTPYIYLLSKKYNHLTVNTAGGLNTSWHIAQGDNIDSQRVVIPPPYINAVSIWDDPSFIQRKLITPFTSGKYFYRQIKTIVYNCVIFPKTLTGISIFWIFCLPGFLFYLLKRKKENGQSINQLLFITTLLYPAGYLLITIDWRYFWILYILILLMNAILISELYNKEVISHTVFKLLSVLVLLSFCRKPLMELISLSGQNRYEHDVAAVLNKEKITGNFITIINNSKHQSSLTTLCYLNHSTLIMAYKIDADLANLKQVTKQYSIQYFIQLYEKDADKKKLLNTNVAKSAIKIYDKLYPGIIIYQLY